MLAEAIHSFADCSNQVLLFIGLKQSARAADAQHPLGYGKASYFWSKEQFPEVQWCFIEPDVED